MAYVSELNTYPIKSGAALSLQTAEFTPSGIMYDRWWMIADTHGTGTLRAVKRPGITSRPIIFTT